MSDFALEARQTVLSQLQKLDFLTCPKNVLDVGPRSALASFTSVLWLMTFWCGRMGVLSVCFRAFPGDRRAPSTTARADVLSPKTRTSSHDFGKVKLQILTTRPTSSLPPRRTTITHHCRSLYRTRKHQIIRWAIVPFVWKRFMQKIPDRCSTSPSVYYRKSEEGRIIVWRRAIICSYVTCTPWRVFGRDSFVSTPQHTDCLEKWLAIKVSFLLVPTVGTC